MKRYNKITLFQKEQCVQWQVWDISSIYTIFALKMCCW